MNYLYSVSSAITSSRIFQWSINRVRAVTYPFYYNHNAWEANLILPESNIWLGSLASACDREALRARGITRIITAVYDLNPIFPDDPELVYLKVPVLDTPTEQIATHFQTAIGFIEDAVSNKRGVLIHCVYGISRSATLMCAYLIKKKSLTVDQAIADVKRQRSIAKPNSGFLLALGAFAGAKKDTFFDESILDSIQECPYSVDKTSPFFTMQSAPTLLLGDESVFSSESLGTNVSGFGSSKRSPRFTIDDEEIF